MSSPLVELLVMPPAAVVIFAGRRDGTPATDRGAITRAA
jgi:hypothetical protein